jgi:glutathione-independent formaldehyde dehydrogenase
MVQPGSSVAVFGAGPVGLLSAYSAVLQGAAQVFVVDYIPERLDLVKKIGAIPIDFSKSDPVAQIKALQCECEASPVQQPVEKKMEKALASINPSSNDPVAEIQILRAGNPSIIESLLPGEEKMKGVMCGIDAVGYQARDRREPSKENPTQVLSDLIRLINPTGHLGVIGVFMSDDPGGVDEHARKGEYMLPFGQLWEKGISIGTGQTPVKAIQIMLRDMIMGGQASPGFIVSHRISLDEAPDAYKEFDKRANGYTKVIIKPQK